MKLKLEYIIILAMFGYIMFISMCHTKPKNIQSDPEIIIERFTDTVEIVKTVEKEIIKHHYDLRVDTIIKSVVDSGLNAYVFNKVDSLINATITVHSTMLPIIDFKYNMKHIETTIERTITDSIVVEVNKSYFRFGANMIGSKTNFGFIPKIGYTGKRGMSYDFGYDVINKNYLFGFSKRIRLFK